MAKKKLSDYFNPKKDVTWERLQFRRTLPGQHDTVQDYAVMLKQKAKYCEFGDDSDNQIHDQILDKWRNIELKKKWYGTSELTLEKLLEIARGFQYQEDLFREARSGPSDNTTVSSDNVSRIKTQTRPVYSSQGKMNGKCSRCGHTDHFQKNCPYKSATCHKCQKVGHLASVCRTKMQNSQKSHRYKPKGQSVRATAEQPNSDEEDNPDDNYHVFHTSGPESAEGESLKFCVNDQDIEFIPDSGAQVTLLPKSTYDKHKDKFPTLQKCSRQIYPYMSNKPLDICGQFYGDIVEPVSGNKITTRIVVVTGNGLALLSRKDSVRLGVIRIGPQVSHITETSEFKNKLKSKYPDLFLEKPGKLNSRQWQLHIDEMVPGVIQKRNRIPFHRREKVKSELNKLMEWDIIEKVDTPTNWVSPIRLVEKPMDRSDYVLT